MKRKSTLDKHEACFIVMTNCLDICVCLLLCSACCQSPDTYSKKWKFPRRNNPSYFIWMAFVGTVINFKMEYVFRCLVCLKNCEKVFVKISKNTLKNGSGNEKPAMGDTFKYRWYSYLTNTVLTFTLNITSVFKIDQNWTA